MTASRSVLVLSGLAVLACSAEPMPGDSSSSTTSAEESGASQSSSSTSSFTVSSDATSEETVAATTATGSDGTATSDSDGSDGSSSDSTGEPAAECPHDEPPASASGTLDWAFGIGTLVYARDLTTDAMDNILVTGSLIQADFGEGPIDTGAPAADGYVAKYDADGELLWVHVMSTPEPDAANAAVVDAGGDVIVGTNDESNALLKLDGDTGEEIWGGPIVDAALGEVNVRALALAPNGDVITTGTVAEHSVLARIDGEGSLLWTRELVSSAFVGSVGVQHTSEGIAWLGHFTGTLELESGDLVAPEFGSGRMGLVGLDEDGNVEWGVAYGPATLDFATFGFVADPCGGFYASGVFRGMLDFGVDPLMSGGGYNDYFLVRFDASGTAEWARRYSEAATSAARKIAIDSEGSVLLTGGIVEADFGVEQFQFDSCNGFVAMINREGEPLWAEAFASDSQTSDAVAVDSQGRVIVVGNYDTSVTIDGFELQGGLDYENYVYVARFEL